MLRIVDKSKGKGKKQLDPGSMGKAKIYHELGLLLTTPGIRGRIESIGILNLIRLCHNAEGGIIKEERFMEEALRENAVNELVKKKFERFKVLLKTEGKLQPELETETRYVSALASRIQRQNQLLAQLKSMLQKEHESREKGAKLQLVIIKPEARAGKDKRPIIYLGEETEFDAKALGPDDEDMKKKIAEINSDKFENLKKDEYPRFKWTLSQKSKSEGFELVTDRIGARHGKAKISGDDWNTSKSAYLEVELYDIKKDETMAKSKPMEIRLMKKDPNEDTFKRLEAAARRIYGEIEKYNKTKDNKTKEGSDLSNNRNLRDWIYENYPSIDNPYYLSFVCEHFHSDAWHILWLWEGDLIIPLHGSPIICVPQLGITLDYKFMKKFFDGYKKGMALKSDDVLKFGRFKYNAEKREYDILEKGMIKPPEKAPSLREIIEEEKKLLKILERILNEPYPKAYKFVAAILKSLLEWYSETKKSLERNEILEANIEESERLFQQMLRFTAWLKRLAGWLEERERKRIEEIKRRKMQEPPTMRIDLLEDRKAKLELEERKIKSRILPILKLAERLEELERKRHEWYVRTYGRLEKKPELSMRMNLLKEAPKIIPVRAERVSEYIDEKGQRVKKITAESAKKELGQILDKFLR